MWWWYLIGALVSGGVVASGRWADRRAERLADQRGDDDQAYPDVSTNVLPPVIHLRGADGSEWIVERGGDER